MALDVDVLEGGDAVLERRLHLDGLGLRWDGRHVLCRGNRIKLEDLLELSLGQWRAGRLRDRSEMTILI